jgi:DHA1 family tetracycline resistance protein-like MFS transporter
MMTHPLFTALKNFKGNARGVVLTEPLWGIPFNLFAPYVSVYMLALGLNDQQIGTVISIGLAFQIVMALVSGMLTDRLGRSPL